MNGRLYRSRDERVLAGVAGGLADYLDVDPSLVRVVWAILALFSGGAFLIIYIVMALVVPEEPWERFAGTGPGGPTASPGQGAFVPPAEGGSAAPGDGAAVPPGEGPAGSPAGGQWSAAQDWRAQRGAWRAQRRAERAARRASGQDGGQAASLVFGLILLAVGVVFLVPIVMPSFAIDRYWPLILVAIGIVLVVAALRPGRPSGR